MEGSVIILISQSIQSILKEFVTGWKRILVIFIPLILIIIFSIINEINKNREEKLKEYLITPINNKIEIKSYLEEIFNNGVLKIYEEELSRKKIKNVQELIIEHLINIDLNYNKHNKGSLEIYHFENQKCPFLRRTGDDNKDLICYENWISSAANKTHKNVIIKKFILTKIRIKKLNESFSKGSYKLMSIYDNKSCNCLNLALETVKKYPNNIFLKYQDRLYIRNGVYFIFKENLNLFLKKNTTRYHTIKIYTLKDEFTSKNQIILKIYYSLVENVRLIDEDFKYLLVEFDLDI